MLFIGRISPVANGCPSFKKSYGRRKWQFPDSPVKSVENILIRSFHPQTSLLSFAVHAAVRT